MEPLLSVQRRISLGEYSAQAEGGRELCRVPGAPSFREWGGPTTGLGESLQKGSFFFPFWTAP